MSAITSRSILLVGRRRRHLDAFADTCESVGVSQIESYASPLGGTVWLAKLTQPNDEAKPTRSLTIDGQDYKRVLDRFYLPTNSDPRLSTALFDFFAPQYEDLIRTEQNIENISNLLQLVLNGCEHTSLSFPLTLST